MTCKDCVHFKDCDDLAFHNFDHRHRMWLMEFWENAEERCKDFEDASKERGEDG